FFFHRATRWSARHEKLGGPWAGRAGLAGEAGGGSGQPCPVQPLEPPPPRGGCLVLTGEKSPQTELERKKTDEEKSRGGSEREGLPFQRGNESERRRLRRRRPGGGCGGARATPACGQEPGGAAEALCELTAPSQSRSRPRCPVPRAHAQAHARRDRAAAAAGGAGADADSGRDAVLPARAGLRPRAARQLVLGRLHRVLRDRRVGGPRRAAGALHQELAVPSVHDGGALMAFGAGVVYITLQSIISYKSYPQWSSRCICYIRISISVVSCIAVIPMIVFASRISITKIDWIPGEKGYIYHFVSAICEWTVAFGFVFYFLTFIRDFQRVTLRISTEIHEDF
uniref:DNA damage regulated autophagy modulator 1 n=1 Tax=Crocodylus porosus TaxID=8502 RepID=A0A7M4FM93_CROPO